MVKASRKWSRYTRKQRGGAWWKWWSKYPPGLSANTIKQLNAAEKEAIRKNVTSKRNARNASALIENFNSGRKPVRRPVGVPENKHEEIANKFDAFHGEIYDPNYVDPSKNSKPYYKYYRKSRY
jgi:hypothetical protein